MRGVFLVFLFGCGGAPSRLDLTWTIDGESQSATHKNEMGMIADDDVANSGSFFEADTEEGKQPFGLQALIYRGFGEGGLVSLSLRRPDDDTYIGDPDHTRIEVTEIEFSRGRSPLVLRGTIASDADASVEVEGTFEVGTRCWDPWYIASGSRNKRGCGTNYGSSQAPQPGYSFSPISLNALGVLVERPPGACPQEVLDASIGDMSLEHDLPKSYVVGGNEMDCQKVKVEDLDYAFCSFETEVSVDDCDYDVKMWNDEDLIRVSARARSSCSLEQNCLSLFSYLPSAR